VIERQLCGSCHHGAHIDGPCQTMTVSGPPSMEAPTRADPHPGRTVTPCECKVSKPYRNGEEIM
jgi:hypothetical protein